MYKYLLNFLLVFLVFSSISFAKMDDAQLQQMYGRDLTNAPFFLRFAYSKQFSRDWGLTDYLERKAFLVDYQAKLALQEAKDKAAAKAQAAQDKEALRQKRDAERQLRDKLRVQAAKDRAERLAEAEHAKEIADADRAQQKELEEMQRLATQGN